MLQYNDENDRKLITSVRCNRFLYDKKEKLYGNKKVKNDVWTRIGMGLTHPLDGHAAESKFYTLRQRYGKERRKVLRSMLNSGAAADKTTYNSTWVLYKELSFLDAVIKPRRPRSSTYTSQLPTNQVHYTTSWLPSTSLSDKLATSSPDLSTSFSYDYKSTDENSDAYSSPSSDFTQMLMKQNETLADLATKISQAISPPAAPNVSSVDKAPFGIQPMLNAIEFALRIIPEHSRLRCLIGILQYINDFNKISDNTMDSNESC